MFGTETLASLFSNTGVDLFGPIHVKHKQCMLIHVAYLSI